MGTQNNPCGNWKKLCRWTTNILKKRDQKSNPDESKNEDDSESNGPKEEIGQFAIALKHPKTCV